MKARILLVDDDASFRRSLVRLLRAHDYEVFDADSVARALEILVTSHPALMLTDIVMPGEDGLYAARKIKAEPRTVALPIIALTASPPAEARDRALFTEILLKPSDAPVLLAAIARALHNVAGPPTS